jgi:hypothetical protein
MKDRGGRVAADSVVCFGEDLEVHEFFLSELSHGDGEAHAVACYLEG